MSPLPTRYRLNLTDMGGTQVAPRRRLNRPAAVVVQVSRFRSSYRFAASSFANFGIEGHQQLIDLVWLRFRSPHCELAAGMMRTSEPPHERRGGVSDGAAALCPRGHRVT